MRLHSVRLTMLAAIAVSGLGTPVFAQPLVDVPILFDVVNVNRSLVDCPTDGVSYRISGHLVAPAAELWAPEPVATVYVPGAMTTERAIYRMQGFAGAYDFAAGMADLGHATVVIDRLGFGDSQTPDAPDGRDQCSGGEADVLHQVVQHLREGTYQTGTNAQEPVAFQRIVLAGHSGGGFTVPIEAYSFRDVDALLLLASALDQGFPPELAVDLFSVAVPACAQGGEEKRPGGPLGWVFFFPFYDELFHDMEPSIQEEFVALGERDACGWLDSHPSALAANQLHLGSIDVPVLFLAAENDYVFPPEAVERQRQLYTGSPDATLVVVENAGHVFTLEKGLADGLPASERVRLEISDWLTQRGFLPEPGALPTCAAGLGLLVLLARRRQRRTRMRG